MFVLTVFFLLGYKERVSEFLCTRFKHAFDVAPLGAHAKPSWHAGAHQKDLSKRSCSTRDRQIALNNLNFLGTCIKFTRKLRKPHP